MNPKIVCQYNEKTKKWEVRYNGELMAEDADYNNALRLAEIAYRKKKK